jgi:ketosteroid isomerase-like protein
MNGADFHDLERRWMGAVQTRDREALQNILDDGFVCTSWSSRGELTSRQEYLTSVDSAEFGCFTVSVDYVQDLGDTAVVRSHLQCDCMLDKQCWHASFLVTDVWLRRGDAWKAISRHASLPLGESPGFIAHHADERKPSTPDLEARRRHAEGA